MSWAQSFSQILKFSGGLACAIISAASAATDLPELFAYAQRVDRLQAMQKSFGSCASWLVATPSALKGFTLNSAIDRLKITWQRIVGETQTVDEQGRVRVARQKDAALIFKENGQLKAFNPLNLDLTDALKRTGIKEENLQVYTSLAELAASRTIPSTDKVDEVTDFLGKFPETQRVFTAVFRSGEIKAYDDYGNFLRGVQTNYNIPGTGVLYQIKDPGQKQPALINISALAGMGSDTSNGISVVPFGQALNVSKNGHYKKLQKKFQAEGKNIPAINFFTTDLPLSGNGLFLTAQERSAGIWPYLLMLGRYQLHQLAITSPNALQVGFGRSASVVLWLEFARQQDAVKAALREEAADREAFDRICPPGKKLLDVLYLFGPTNLIPEKGYDYSLQQSIDDSLNSASTGYRPNWPSFDWCHDLYLEVRDIQKQVSTSWEDYFQQVFKDITVRVFVGEQDQQTAPQARDFFRQLRDKLPKEQYDYDYQEIAKAGHDPSGNTVSNRGDYDPVPFLKDLLGGLQGLLDKRVRELVDEEVNEANVDVNDVEVSGQIRLAARVGQSP